MHRNYARQSVADRRLATAATSDPQLIARLCRLAACDKLTALFSSARLERSPIRAVFWKLLFLFVTVPVVELFLLLVISRYLLDPLATIALVIITGIVGAWLAQWQGTRAFGRIRGDLAAGKMPTDSVVDAVLIFLAGAFLMTPGVLTDMLGFTLLVPAGRRLVKRFLTRWFKSSFHIESLQPSNSPAAGDRVIDSYAVNSGDDNSSQPD